MVVPTSRITIGHHKHAISSSKGIGAPDRLVKKTRETNRVSFGAVAVHDKIGVGNVILVVVALDIVTIPARGEHDLQAKTVGAVAVEIFFVGHVVAVQSPLRLFAVVETVESQRPLLEALLVSLAQRAPRRLLGVRHAGVTSSEGTTLRVSSQHLEVGREAGDILAIKEIVPINHESLDLNQKHHENLRKHAANLFDELELASVGILEVHSRGPV